VWVIAFLTGSIKIEVTGVVYDLCSLGWLVRSSGYTILALYTCLWINEVLIIVVGLRGGPLEEYKRRKPMRILLYIEAFLLITTLVFTIYGTYVVASPAVDQSCWSDNPCLYSDDLPLACSGDSAGEVNELSPECKMIYDNRHLFLNECNLEYLDYSATYAVSQYNTSLTPPFNVLEKSECNRSVEADSVEFVDWVNSNLDGGEAVQLIMAIQALLPNDNSGRKEKLDNAMIDEFNKNLTQVKNLTLLIREAIFTTLGLPDQSQAPWMHCLDSKCDGLDKAGLECQSWDILLAVPENTSYKHNFMSLIITSWCILAFTGLLVFFGYNSYQDIDAVDSWEGSLRTLSKCLCCSGALFNNSGAADAILQGFEGQEGDYDEGGGGGGPPSQQIARFLAELLGGIDLDPTDRFLAVYLVAERQHFRRKRHVSNVLKNAGIKFAPEKNDGAFKQWSRCCWNLSSTQQGKTDTITTTTTENKPDDGRWKLSDSHHQGSGRLLMQPSAVAPLMLDEMHELQRDGDTTTITTDSSCSLPHPSSSALLRPMDSGLSQKSQISSSSITHSIVISPSADETTLVGLHSGEEGFSPPKSPFDSAASPFFMDEDKDDDTDGAAPEGTISYILDGKKSSILSDPGKLSDCDDVGKVPMMVQFSFIRLASSRTFGRGTKYNNNNSNGDDNNKKVKTPGDGGGGSFEEIVVDVEKKRSGRRRRLSSLPSTVPSEGDGRQADGTINEEPSADHEKVTKGNNHNRGLKIKVANQLRPMLTPAGQDSLPALHPSQSISPYSAALLYLGIQLPVAVGELEAIKAMWSFAVAAYGLQGSVWNKGEKPGMCSGNLKMLMKCLGKPLRLDDHFKKRNFSAILDITGVQASDVLYVSHANMSGGVLPYLIVVDRQSPSINICIRGTVSVEDLVTDLLSNPVEVGAWLPQWVVSENKRNHGGEGMYAHTGVVGSTNAILKDLESQGILRELKAGKLARMKPPPQHKAMRNINDGTTTTNTTTTTHDTFQHDMLEQLASLRPEDAVVLPLERAQSVIHDKLSTHGWKLTITGHSLGAAVGSLLALHLKQEFPDVHCVAFNPPGGLLSKNLSDISASVCTSVIVGKDVISRLSFKTAKRVVDEMAIALARCQKPKLRIAAEAMMGSRQRAAAASTFMPFEEIGEEAVEVLERYYESSKLHSSSASTMEMFPPGKLMFLRPFKGTGGMKKKGGNKDGGKSTTTWDAVWISGEQLMGEGILLSPAMLQHHRMFTVRDALESAMQQSVDARKEEGGV